MTQRVSRSAIFVFHRFLRPFAVLLLLCVVLLGCSAAGERSAYSEENESEADIPVSGEVRPRVAMTFDDGPHNVRTKQIVDELNKYGWNATFFVVGNRVDGTEYAGGEAMQYAIKAGNEVGIHGYTHKYSYKTCSDTTYDQELAWTEQAIREKKPGYQTTLMRPIGGEITSARANECAYSVILWSVDSEDWKHKIDESEEDHEKNVNTIVNNVISGISEGDIILMHDLYQNTYEATVIILQCLYEMGYDVVTVSELLGDELQPGTVYTKG
ncbi:MAG: polysaccharide deacetylase family protein [Clostridia bacterium]|nr:polysaccharide deacetylase family protein [Clostridia bacterium]